MKKLLALLLAMVMLLGMLAGCSKKNETTDGTSETEKTIVNQQNKNEESGEPTEPKPEQLFGVTVGTELDAPEKVFSAEDLKMFYVSLNRKVEGVMQTTEISMVEAEDGSVLIFAVNGPGSSKEAVYEITETGVTKYLKSSGDKPYKLDEKTTAEEVATEAVTLTAYILLFTEYSELDAFKGIKYRKSSDVTINCPTGDVYVYDVLLDGKVAGQVCIDRQTGLLVKAKDLTAAQSVLVNSFRTTDVQIPEIANAETPAEGETTETEPQA